MLKILALTWFLALNLVSSSKVTTFASPAYTIPIPHLNDDVSALICSHLPSKDLKNVRLLNKNSRNHIVTRTPFGGLYSHTVAPTSRDVKIWKKVKSECWRSLRFSPDRPRACLEAMLSLQNRHFPGDFRYDGPLIENPIFHIETVNIDSLGHKRIQDYVKKIDPDYVTTLNLNFNLKKGVSAKNGIAYFKKISKVISRWKNLIDIRIIFTDLVMQPTAEILHKIISGLKSLEKVSFKGVVAEYVCTDLISSLVDVKNSLTEFNFEVILKSNDIVRALASTIPQLQKLKSLKIVQYATDNQALGALHQSISQLQALKNLEVECVDGIFSPSLKQELPKLKHLESISLPNVNFEEFNSVLKTMEDIKSLKEFKNSAFTYQNNQRYILSEFDVKIGKDQSFRSLESLDIPAVEELKLSNRFIPNYNYDNIKKYVIRRFPVHRGNLLRISPFLKTMKKAEEVEFNYVNFDQSSFGELISILVQYPNLKTLRITSSRLTITQAHILSVNLSNFKSLQLLDLTGNFIKDTVVSELGKAMFQSSCSLRSIMFTENFFLSYAYLNLFEKLKIVSDHEFFILIDENKGL